MNQEPAQAPTISFVQHVSLAATLTGPIPQNVSPEAHVVRFQGVLQALISSKAFDPNAVTKAQTRRPISVTVVGYETISRKGHEKLQIHYVPDTLGKFTPRDGVESKTTAFLSTPEGQNSLAAIEHIATLPGRRALLTIENENGADGKKYATIIAVEPSGVALAPGSESARHAHNAQGRYPMGNQQQQGGFPPQQQGGYQAQQQGGYQVQQGGYPPQQQGGYQAQQPQPQGDYQPVPVGAGGFPAL